MRMYYKNRLALWLSVATTSNFQARAFTLHKAFVPRTAAFRRHMSTSTSTDADNRLRVALCQFGATEDKNLNHETCRKHMSRAVEQGAKLIVLPVSLLLAYSMLCSWIFSHFHHLL